MLEFIVNNQNTIRADTERITSDAVEFVPFKVHFSEEWEGYTKTVRFSRDEGETDFDVVPVENDVLYYVPAGALSGEQGETIEVQVSAFGVKGEKSRATSSIVTLTVQPSGIAGKSLTPEDPDAYNQFVQLVITERQKAEAAAETAAADTIEQLQPTIAEINAAREAAAGSANTATQQAQTAQLEAEKVQKIVAGNEAYTKAETDQKYATAPTKTAIGTGTIVLDDCDQGSIPVGFMGASEQYQATANKNLFDLEYQKLYGINENRYVNVNGVITTPTSDEDWKVSYYIKVKPSTVYAFTDLPTSSVTAIAFYTQDKTFISAVTNMAVLQNGGRVTSPSNCEYMRVSYRGMVENTLQLEEGGTATAYVQGTVETPSPDYPSEVRSVGDIPKDSNGIEIRNVVDIEDVVMAPDSEWTVVRNNIFSVPIWVDKRKISGRLFDRFYVPLGLNIGLSTVNNTLTDGTNGFYLPTPESAIKGFDFSTASQVYLFIYTGTVEYQLSEIKEMLKNNITKFMFTYAAEVDEYRPYIGDNNACLHVINQDGAGNNVTDDYIILKEPLRGIPDGQGGWLARDVIDADGNVVQNVLKHTWDGASGDLYASSGIDETLIAISGTVSGLSAYKKRQGLSNKFGFISSPSSVQKEVASVANTSAFLVIKKERLETVDLAGIKKWLKEQYDAKEPVIQYLATETPITYKVALPDFKTAEGRTLIMTPSGAAPLPDIFAEYKQTVKGSAVEAITEDKNRKIYGVEIARQANGDIQSSPTLTRTDDAVGMTANASTDGNAVVNDFDTAPDWPRLIRCNGYYTDTGQFVVTAYKGEPGYKEDGSNGNVWVQIERFYHEHVETAEKITDRISTKPFPGAILPDIFVGKDGKPLRYAYKGAYEGATVGGKLVSYSGVKPGGHSMNTAIAQARAAGPYCHIGTTSENEIIRLLIQIEFATLNGQAAIGNGVSTLRYTFSPVDMATVATTNSNKIIVANATAALFVVGQYIGIGATDTSGSIAEFRKITGIATYDSANKAITFDGAAVNIPVGSFISSRVYYTGNADAVKASSGTVSNDGKHANIYRGFENPFGNCWEVMGDVIFHNGQSTYYKCANPDKWVTNSTLSDDYIPLRYAPSSTEGYVKAFGYDKRFPYSRLTTKVGGSSATYYCDYFYRPPVTASPDTLREVLLGGHFYGGAGGGPGCWYLDNAVSNSNWNIAGRLSGTGCGGLGEPSPSDQTTE